MPSPSILESGPKVGDKVGYLPPVEHALDRDMAGNMPWQLGIKERAPGAKEETVRHLSDADAAKVLRHARRRPARKDAVIPIRPKMVWPAEVKAINPDGTLALYISHHLQGVTLEYSPVAQDQTKTKPGTWHSL